jgi:hypothetical protein
VWLLFFTQVVAPENADLDERAGIAIFAPEFGSSAVGL